MLRIITNENTMDIISFRDDSFSVKIVTLSRGTIVSIFVNRKLIQPSGDASNTSK